MGQVIHTLLLPRDGTKDGLYKNHYRFWISQSYHSCSNKIKWASFTQAQTYKFASEHSSFDSIRTSSVKIRYTKSFIYFMQFLCWHFSRLQWYVRYSINYLVTSTPFKGFTFKVLLFVKTTIPGFAPCGFFTNWTWQ